MANQNIEIEIKLPLNNPSALKDFLDKNANLTATDTYQKDTYYTPKHRDFLATEYTYEYLRLRNSTKGLFINYKHFYPENQEETDYCEEFETKIDNIDAMEKMFTSLNFKEVGIVEKLRSTWEYKDVEIAIDKVSNLGAYLELEAEGNFKDPQEGRKYLYQILHEINADVGEEEHRKYPDLVLAAQKQS